MFDAIRYAQDQDEISALIVIIMSHGVQGSIEAADGRVRIQDILSTMCSPTLDGKVFFINTFGFKYANTTTILHTIPYSGVYFREFRPLLFAVLSLPRIKTRPKHSE